MTTPKIDEELVNAAEKHEIELYAYFADGGYSSKQVQGAFIEGAKFQEERSCAEIEKLKLEKQIFRDAISEVICHSHDIMAKKVCSRALAEVEGTNE